MSESFSEKDLVLLAKIVKNLPVSETRLKNLIGELYPIVIAQPFVIKIQPKTKKGVLKINFTPEFKKELKNYQYENTNLSKSLQAPLYQDEKFEKYLTNLINSQLAPIIQRLQDLEKMVKNNNKTLNHDIYSDLMLKDEFIPRLKEIYDKININEHKGGMIPIPTIWKELGKENINFSVFTQYLYDLERNRIIDLQIVSDRRNIPNLELGIEDKVRGLLYYIVWRN